MHLRLRKCEKLPYVYCRFAVAEHLLQFCEICGCVIECKFAVTSTDDNTPNTGTVNSQIDLLAAVGLKNDTVLVILCHFERK